MSTLDKGQLVARVDTTPLTRGGEPIAYEQWLIPENGDELTVGEGGALLLKDLRFII